jgi:hypothetical protein
MALLFSWLLGFYVVDMFIYDSWEATTASQACRPPPLIHAVGQPDPARTMNTRRAYRAIVTKIHPGQAARVGRSLGDYRWVSGMARDEIRSCKMIDGLEWLFVP